jgi:hypothetical protein
MSPEALERVGKKKMKIIANPLPYMGRGLCTVYELVYMPEEYVKDGLVNMMINMTHE